jgi:hypothetical protein
MKKIFVIAAISCIYLSALASTHQDDYFSANIPAAKAWTSDSAIFNSKNNCHCSREALQKSSYRLT